MAGQVPAIALIGIDKRFGEVRANKNVNLTVARGSVHGIVGENGAGKSTLMSILYGFYEADRGTIEINGKEVRIRTPKEAIAAGIGMVHQHFMLVDPLSVIENVMLFLSELQKKSDDSALDVGMFVQDYLSGKTVSTEYFFGKLRTIDFGQIFKNYAQNKDVETLTFEVKEEKKKPIKSKVTFEDAENFLIEMITS